MTELESGAELEYETPVWPETRPSDWVTFHLAHPGRGNGPTNGPWDPNCIFHWKGRYHLFYIQPRADGPAFAHVSSPDMVRWTWHPTTLTPSAMGHGMFSGTGFVTKEGRPAIIYHGAGSGRNQIAIAEDDQLEVWSPPRAIESRVRPDQDGSVISEWDPDGWLEGDTYYAIFGRLGSSESLATLHRSRDLQTWDYVGPFLSADLPEAADDSDLSGPNFFEIGGKRMLLCISHNKGCRYYIGEWRDEKFIPEFHGRMNWRGIDVFAVESVLTPDGRRVMWAWCPMANLMDEVVVAAQEAAPPPQRGIQSLPRELSLPEDGILRIRPLRELESLRADEVRRDGVVVTAGVPVLLDGIAGDALELDVTIRPGSATRVGVRVCCDSGGRGGLDVVIDRESRTLAIGDVVAPFAPDEGESLRLRVFIDKHLVEAFANDRQAMVSSHPYDLSTVSTVLIAEGGDAGADVTAWRMRSIFDPAPVVA